MFISSLGLSRENIKPRPNDRNMRMQHCWAQHIVCVWPPCCDVLRHVGCCWLKFEDGQIWANNTQHVATEWPNARNMLSPTMLPYVALACCDRLAGTSQEKNFKPKSSWMMAKAKDCFPNEVNLNFEKLSEIVNLFKFLIWLLRQPSHKTHGHHLPFQIRHEEHALFLTCALVDHSFSSFVIVLNYLRSGTAYMLRVLISDGTSCGLQAFNRGKSF